MVKKGQHYGYLPTHSKPWRVETGVRWNALSFMQVQPHHILYQLLPRPKATGHNLQQRAHNLTLPSYTGSTTTQNFIPRMLFIDVLISFTLQIVSLCFIHFMYNFLLCCNASAFVICAIKNYLLTYSTVQVLYCFPVCSLTLVQSCSANSAFHPSGVGKWVPALAGKAKAGMVQFPSG